MSLKSIGHWPYSHRPLNLEQRQIRLLRMEPEKVDLRGNHYSLEIFEIANAPPYTALSYTWELKPGWPTNLTIAVDKTYILVDGRPLYITANLHNFFEMYGTLDDPDEASQYFWVDQISIDQDDTRERNHQVQLMSEIFRASQRVLIWLGIGTGRFALGLHQSKRARHRKSPPSIPSSKVSNSNIASSQGLNDLKFIVETPYFKRLWVVQEILLARRISVLAGDTWVSWDALCDYTNLQLSPEFAYLRHSEAFSLFTMSRKGSENHFDLQECVRRFCIMKCRNPMDKVYGLMGLISSEYALAVDYDKSVHQLILELVEALIREHIEWRPPQVKSRGNFQEVAQKVAWEMGMEDEEVLPLGMMLDTLWTPRMLDRLKSRRYIMINMGFEPCGDDEQGKGRWWYELKGVKRCFPCL